MPAPNTVTTPHDMLIVVYCAGPKCPQSLQAAQKLMDLGYTNVKAYEGGLEEWTNAGNKIERLEQASAA